VPDLIAQAETWFEAKRRDHLAVMVEYRPAVGLARQCRATLVVGKWDAVTKDGNVVRFETRDFLIHRDDLAVDPKRGDRIAVVENGAEQLYEVAIPAGADNAWKWSDRSEKLRRIHTQRIETNTPAATGPLLVRAVGASTAAAITDQQIVAQLTLTLGTNRAASSTIAATAAYIYVVLPASFNAPTITLNGFVTTAWELTTRSITFSGQAARSYAIYRSTYPITGTVAVEVA
jgi:hypothetical protein